MQSPTFDNLTELIKIRIQISRNQRRKQMQLDLNTAIPAAELDEKDSSKEKHAAEIFLHEELNIPYYFGMERLSALATNNVNELLFLAAALYDNLKTKRVLRHRDPVLKPREQEKTEQPTRAPGPGLAPPSGPSSPSRSSICHAMPICFICT